MSRTTIHPQASTLPQLAADLFIADGGLETSLVFIEDIDLPDFAAFPLLDTQEGRAALERYYRPYFDVAETHGVGLVLDTPTWRANSDWGTRLGYDARALTAVNEAAVRFVGELAGRRPAVETVLNGAIGPRGDGYVVGETMTDTEAARYHALQAKAFASAGADMITSVTMTYVEEAVGIARAAESVGLPVATGFTVETDGRLPSGKTPEQAITEVDAATGGYPAYYMINCAHPTHFVGAFEKAAPWLGRVKAIRANASKMSHAELDESEVLDRGEPFELAAEYRRLQSLLPDLRLVGGCCGTDHEHISVIAAALLAA